MLLVQDQYVQNSRKNFDSEFQLKQNTSKQVLSDPKEVWEIESGCEEEIITSGNETEGEEQNLYVDSPQFPEEIFQTRQTKPRKKNVRFGENFNFVMEHSETSSVDNEYFDCGYLEGDRRKSLNQQHEISGCKANDHFRVPPTTKWRNLDCGFNKTRPRSVPEKFAGCSDGLEKRQVSLGDCERTRRKEHRCGKYRCREFDGITYQKPMSKGSKFECGDDTIARCCDYCLEKKGFVKMKPMPTTSHKHVCHMTRDVHHDADRYCQEDYYDRGYPGKGRKKPLEVVQEQQEQFSDSTYKMPFSKFSSHSVAGEVTECPRTEHLVNSSMSDWLYCGGRGGWGSSGHQRINKMRSRRTRINKIKNGWKKALVQTVRDGNRNERVGVIVMGSKGPEFYSKNGKPCEFVPFRKTKSFLDGASTSFEVMTVDCKNVFLSSSDTGPRANQTISEFPYPEDDLKMEEKIANFSKNVNDIVRHSEEKFYKALSEYPGKKAENGEGDVPEEVANKDEKKDGASKSKYPYGLFSSSPVPMSPRVPKPLRQSEQKVSLDSKAMADALNEQAKQYIENQGRVKDEDSFMEGMKELKEKYPPKELSQETIEANLSLWGMKLDQLSENNEIKEQKEVTDESRKKEEEKARREKEERSQIESVRSGNDKLSSSSRQRRMVEDEAEATGSKRQSHPSIPNRTPKSKSGESPRQKQPEDADSNLISAMFRDLIKNGCAISQEESENLQSVFKQIPPHSNDVISSSSSTDGIKNVKERKLNVIPGSPKTPISLECAKKENEERRKARDREFENLLEEVGKTKTQKHEKFLISKSCKKTQGKQKEGKGKRMGVLEDKMKLLRQALPSLAAENEAAHLKQLKKYIDKFIGRAEASTTSEFSRRKEGRRKVKSGSTDSSEVRVDACKILDFVSDPFKKISSEVTINIAKKLTDTLVQDRSLGCPRKCPALSKARKQSENETDDEGLLPCVSSGDSDRCDESEPTYLKQLKKMRNEHLNNILLEVKRLSELLRFLDRCNRLHF